MRNLNRTTFFGIDEHFVRNQHIKAGTWISGVVVLLQLIFSERKRREWQETIEALDAANRKIEQILAGIDALNANRSRA